MNGVNLNLSVLKRDTRDADEIDTILKNDGWTLTGSIGANDRIRYYEQSGINITTVKGPAGTLIFPSGPIRGSIFSDRGSILNLQGTLGDNEGASSDTRSGQIKTKTHT